MTYSNSHLQVLQLMTLSSLYNNAFHCPQISVKAAGVQRSISKVCLIKWPMIQHSFVECYVDSYIITRNVILKMRLKGHVSEIHLKINLSHFLSVNSHTNYSYASLIILSGFGHILCNDSTSGWPKVQVNFLHVSTCTFYPVQRHTIYTGARTARSSS